MGHPLQNAIDNLEKSINLSIIHFEIEKISELGKNFSNTISKFNEITEESIAKLKGAGDYLKSITDDFKFGNLSQQVQDSINLMRIDARNIDSIVGISNNYFNNFNPIDIDSPYQYSGIYWN